MKSKADCSGRSAAVLREDLPAKYHSDGAPLNEQRNVIRAAVQCDAPSPDAISADEAHSTEPFLIIDTVSETLSTDIAFRYFKDIAEDLSRSDMTFPTFLQASAAVREALTREDWSNAALAHLVTGEPLLSARVVALANSAALNPGGVEVGDVRNACLRVGHRAVRNLATTLLIEQAAGAKELTPFRTQAQEIWEHSLAVAVIAYVLAQKTGRWSPDEALFAGLVHDLGHFYLYWRATRFEELVSHPAEIRALVHDWHPAIGQRLMWDLHLPESVVKACEDHESPPGTLPAGSLSELLSVANLCSMAHADDPLEAPPVLPDPARLSVHDAHLILKEHSLAVASMLSALLGVGSAPK